MEIIIADTYEALSKKAAHDLLHLLQPLQQPLICTASGDTPAGLYRNLVQQYGQQQFDPSQWRFVGLDEWSGMNGTTEGSCRYYVDQQLFNPLEVEAQHICFFDGTAENLEAECSRVEAFIQAQGGIEVAILGLGLNGHVGMNEPGTSPFLHSHIAALDPETQQVGQKYFKQPQQLSEGITLGLATLLEARHIFLLVSGRRKAEIVKKVIEENPTENIPATLLRDHPDFRLYLDAEAAHLLNGNS